MIDPYQILGLIKTCTIKQIRKAYRMAAKDNHPDTGGDPEKFALIKLAHDILCDADKRKKFDDYGFVDEDPEAKLATDVIANLRMLFFQVLQQIPDDKLEYRDVVAAIKQFIVGKSLALTQQIQSFIEQEKKQRASLKIIEKRLKRKKAQPNFLVEALRESLAGIPQQLKSIEYQQKIAGEMLVVLEDFSYTFEAEPEPIPQVFKAAWGSIYINGKLHE